MKNRGRLGARTAAEFVKSINRAIVLGLVENEIAAAIQADYDLEFGGKVPGQGPGVHARRAARTMLRLLREQR